jgi:DNA-binding NtrC family response regulator
VAHICVIDDQEVMRESVAQTLLRADHEVTAFADSKRALAAILKADYDVIVTDLKMPGLDGIEIVKSVRDAQCDIPIIIMTAFATVPRAVQAIRFGAYDFIQKPFDGDNLIMQIERALQHRRLRNENAALKTSLDDLRKNRTMIGDGPAMTEIRQEITQYARSDATVMITGESGTGKELAAAAVYQASARSDRPMLCVNCAALSANLLESELFGHEKGAFTGADRVRQGRFELADGGTLLLDEVSEMALPLQAKLLRVLQEGEYERVGSSQTRRSDVRVIATTNRELDRWVTKKRFRADLYYRLNVLPLSLPPLRERIDDIPTIVHHFLKRMTQAAGRTDFVIDSPAMDALVQYPWPGNIRELENVCQRAVATVYEDRITLAHVEQWLSAQPDASEPFARLRPGRMLEDMERQLIEQTLHRYKGHRVNSAKALGMGVRTLGMKLKQWRDSDDLTDNRTENLVNA